MENGTAVDEQGVLTTPQQKRKEENIMTVEEWLGEENQLGTDIWTKKYCNDGETFDEWIQRISGGNEEIAEYIRQKNSCSEAEFSPTEDWISREGK